MNYTAAAERYGTMAYHRCGNSGLKLPELSLGLWHNFGDTSVYENMKQLIFTAFDHGITHLIWRTTTDRPTGARNGTSGKS